MSGYNFKSSGVKLKSLPESDKIVSTGLNSNNAIIPQKIGIKTPLQMGTDVNDEIVAMNMTLSEQISDNLRNLILTNWGERLGRFDYGANISPLLSEQDSFESIESTLMENISNAIQKWMPFVNPLSLTYEQPQTNSFNINIIKISIDYSIPIISSEKKNLAITLRVI